MEMAAYLKTEDVICPNRKTVDNVGIRKFASANNTEEAVFECKNSKSSRGHARRSELLSAILCDLTDSNSDEELPPFMVSSSHSNALDTNMDSNNKGESLKGMDGENVHDGQCVSIQKTVSPTTFKFGEGKLETFLGKHSMDVGEKSSAKVTSAGVKSSKRKKKRASGSNRKVIEILLDDGDDDFVLPVEDGLCDITEEISCGQLEEAMEVESLAPDKRQSESEEEGKAAFDLETARLSQLLPDVRLADKGCNSPGDILQGSYERSDRHIATPDDLAKQTYCVSIPSPPPIEQIEVAFSKLGNGSFPELDLVQLVDEWEQEKSEAGQHRSRIKTSAESRLSSRLFGSPVSTAMETKTEVGSGSVRASLESEFHTSNGLYKGSEKKSFRDMGVDENLIDVPDQQLPEENRISNNDMQVNKSYGQCMTENDCVMGKDVGSIEIHMLNKCGAKEKFSQCSQHEIGNNIPAPANQVAEIVAISRDLLHNVPSSPLDSSVDEAHGLENVQLQTGPDVMDEFDNEEYSDHSPSMLDVDPTYSKEPKSEASAGSVNQQEMCEHYGDWDFSVSDLEDDVEAERGKNLHVSELPKSPVIKPCSLPVWSNSSTVTPIIKQASDPDLNNCFDQSNLFLSAMKTPVTIPNGSHLRSSDSAIKPTPGKTAAAGLDESHVTFTQALACLHDSPALTQAFRPESPEKSVVKEEPETDDELDSKARKILLSPKSDSGSSDKGDFELGFSWDDVDVVPPSPVHDLSISQKLSKCSQSLVFGKRKLPASKEEHTTESSQCLPVSNAEQSGLDVDVLAIPFEESVVFSKTNCTNEPLESTSRKLSSESPPTVLRNNRKLPASHLSPPAMSENISELPGSPVFTPPAFLSARGKI